MHIDKAGGNGAITGVDDRICRRKCFVLFQDSPDPVILDQDMPDERPVSKAVYYFATA
jgi:hypothetical protein